MNRFRVVVMLCAMLAMIGCENQPAKSTSGVCKATAKVPTGPDCLTSEQRNVRDRLTEDNKPGSIKPLYVISAYSGQVLIYSTVKGKVTSGGKRLSPSSASVYGGSPTGFAVDFGGSTAYTNEVLADDGAYGSSMDYLFWWDTNDVYHQHYVCGGQILHVTNQPLAVKNVVINMEVTTKAREEGGVK